MITKTKAYTSSDGQVHATLEAAQRAELTAIFPACGATDSGYWPTDAIVNVICANADKIKDVLTTSNKSRPGARAINGATRKAKTKAKPPVAPPVAHERVAGAYKEMRAAVETATAGV